MTNEAKMDRLESAGRSSPHTNFLTVTILWDQELKQENMRERQHALPASVFWRAGLICLMVTTSLTVPSTVPLCQALLLPKPLLPSRSPVLRTLSVRHATIPDKEASSQNAVVEQQQPPHQMPDMEAYARGYTTVFQELPCQACTAIGSVPQDLKGSYFRAGPAMFSAGSLPPPFL